MSVLAQLTRLSQLASAAADVQTTFEDTDAGPVEHVSVFPSECVPLIAGLTVFVGEPLAAVGVTELLCDSKLDPDAFDAVTAQTMSSPTTDEVTT